MKTVNRLWSFLIVFRFQNRHKGIVIVLVLVLLIIGMGAVILYLSTVRSQRKFDELYEQDLRAYYLSESGFQYTSGKLYESERYEQRWYYPNLNVSVQKQFQNIGQSSHGAFQTYLTQIDDDQKFSHLFLLSKGIYYTGKISPGGGSEKVTAIIKGNLGYSPKPPSNKKQLLFIMGKSPLNQSQLLEFIGQPKLKHLFAVDNGVIPSKIRSLMEFLKTNKLEDIDFSSEPALMQGIAQLDHLNQKIKTIKRLSKAADSQFHTFVEYPSFPAHLPKTRALSFLSEVKLKLFNELVGSSRSIEKIQDTFSEQTVSLTDKFRAKLLSRESLNLLEHLPTSTRVDLDRKTDFLIKEWEDLSIDQFRDLILERSSDFGSLKVLLESKIIIKASGNSQFYLRDINELGGVSKTIEILSGSNNPAELEDETQAAVLNQLKPKDSQLPTSDYSNTVKEDHSEKSEARKEVDILKSENPFGPEGQERILGTLYQPMFNNVSLNEAVYDENISNGFLKVFLNSLSDQLHEFALETQLLWDRDPTPEEYHQFRSENPIPSLTTITKIGNILDDLFSSPNYSFHYGANVDSSKGSYNINISEGTYTVVERSPEAMHMELQNKLTTYYFTHGATNDKNFLEMFRKSTWGDSSSANSISKGDEFHSSKHRTDYFIRHKTTGEEIKLFDYLKNRL